MLCTLPSVSCLECSGQRASIHDCLAGRGSLKPRKRSPAPRVIPAQHERQRFLSQAQQLRMGEAAGLDDVAHESGESARIVAPGFCLAHVDVTQVGDRASQCRQGRT